MNHPRICYHGETRGEIPGEVFARAEVYVAHDLDLAMTYAEEGGRVLEVEDLSEQPLLLHSPELFVEAWEASGADAVDGPFHPGMTGVFAAWARDRGHDAIVIPASAFEGDLGYEEVEGRFGEPQTIFLYPERLRVKRVVDNR